MIIRKWKFYIVDRESSDLGVIVGACSSRDEAERFIARYLREIENAGIEVYRVLSAYDAGYYDRSRLSYLRVLTREQKENAGLIFNIDRENSPRNPFRWHNTGCFSYRRGKSIPFTQSVQVRGITHLPPLW